ncbi:hypothetical protein GCM10008956_29470 [Deinococcus arenae]|uniref:Uncharacterized protein n=1 Tax=Deinococcus arenae TaxID=1452751 RepID=A0A8H9L9U9_9DEIO|nr:hypothetical protein GCM10008956_29470 [Deinococcus arenae]
MHRLRAVQREHVGLFGGADQCTHLMSGGGGLRGHAAAHAASRSDHCEIHEAQLRPARAGTLRHAPRFPLRQSAQAPGRGAGVSCDQ